MPTYNRSALIGRALDSVLSQSYPPYEVIVVDDGSDDETECVLRGYADRVTVIRQARAGPSAARNRGVEASTGDWLSFLDSDDWYYPDRLRLYAQWIEREPGLECIFGVTDWMDAGGTLISMNLAELESGRRLLKTAGKSIEAKLTVDDLEAFAFETIGSTNTVSLRRDRFLALGGFPTQYSIGEDRFLWLKVAAHCSQMGVILQSSACYTTHDGRTFQRGTLSANKVSVRCEIGILKASEGYPASLRLGIRRRLCTARRDLGHAYIRNGQHMQAICAVLPSLWENPGYASVRNLLSMLRG